MPIIPDLDYGRRTGVTSLKRQVVALCKLYEAFKPLIDLWVTATFTDTSDLAKVRTLLDSLVLACNIIKTAPDD